MLTVLSLLSNMATVGLLMGVSLKVIMLLFPEHSTSDPDQKARKS